MAEIVKKNTQLIENNDVNEFDRRVIDEYFLNGFNATRAVLAVKPEYKYHSAASKAGEILKDPRNKGYIQQIQQRHNAFVNLEAYQLLGELKNIAMADVTVFLGKTEEEVQDMPADIRRTLKKITVKEKSYKNAEGRPTTERTYVYELNDKLTAIEKIGRHIGFYEADNRQRQVNINLNDFDNVTLNNILQVVEKAQDSEKP